MYIFYNGDILERSSLDIGLDNRAFMYGDGVFETIIMQDGLIKFEQYHKERLRAAMSAMSLVLNENLTINSIFFSIGQLVQKEEHLTARIRLQVWRAYGGLYTPQSNDCDIMANCTPYEPIELSTKRKVSFAQTVKLSKTNWSTFKTISAMPYIQAGIEKTQRILDELILLDHHDHISECTSSNIFWKQGDSYFTPSLGTGCIDGIMRRHVMHQLDIHDVKLEIGEYSQKELLQAEEVFSTNVTGIQSLLSIDEHQFSSTISIIPLLEL